MKEIHPINKGFIDVQINLFQLLYRFVKPPFFMMVNFNHGSFYFRKLNSNQDEKKLFLNNDYVGIFLLSKGKTSF